LWDRVAYSIKKMDDLVIRLGYPERLAFDFREVTRARVTWRILRACKDARPFDESRFSDELAAQSGVCVDAQELARTLFISWDAARAMAASGMTIGSHTATHPVLSALPEAAQRRELLESSDRLASVLGSVPEMLAYPVGGPHAFTDVTRRLAREAGYRAAFSYGGPITRSWPVDPFAVPRVAVERAHSPAQFRLRSTFATVQAPPAIWRTAARLQSRF
jgi:hypothetical protein